MILSTNLVSRFTAQFPLEILGACDLLPAALVVQEDGELIQQEFFDLAAATESVGVHQLPSCGRQHAIKSVAEDRK